MKKKAKLLKKSNKMSKRDMSDIGWWVALEIVKTIMRQNMRMRIFIASSAESLIKAFRSLKDE